MYTGPIAMKKVLQGKLRGASIFASHNLLHTDREFRNYHIANLSPPIQFVLFGNPPLVGSTVRVSQVKKESTLMKDLNTYIVRV